MNSNARTEQFSELVGDIYDCAIDPSRWEATLEKIRIAYGFATTGLNLVSIPTMAAMLVKATNISPDRIAQIPKYAASGMELWGGPGRMMSYPMEEPVINSYVWDPSILADNVYYQEWAMPYGLFDQVAMVLVRDSTMVGAFSMGRHISQGEISEADVAPLRLIAPHLRRAVTISHLLDIRQLEVATLAATLDLQTSAILLVDAAMGLVHANSAGTKLLERGSPIRSTAGRVKAPYELADEALAAAVQQSTRDEAGLGRRGIGVPVRDADGKAFVVHVMPLRGTEIRANLSVRAVAALFVAPASTPPQLPSAALTLLYDLTPSEVRIVEMISSGRTSAEISNDLGVAPSTVKTHLLRIFDKTGTKRQADLIRLANSLTLPV